MTRFLYIIFFSVCIFVFTALTCNRHQIKQTQLHNHIFITDKKNKYWDTKIGYGFFFKEDSNVFQEYIYSHDGVRVFPDYGDVIIDDMRWNIMLDTLFIIINKQVYTKYLILQLNENTMKLRDFSKSWGKDTLFFYKSLDQKSNILKKGALSDDTSKWKVKYRKW